MANIFQSARYVLLSVSLVDGEGLVVVGFASTLAAQFLVLREGLLDLVLLYPIYLRFSRTLDVRLPIVILNPTIFDVRLVVFLTVEGSPVNYGLRLIVWSEPKNKERVRR